MSLFARLRLRWRWLVGALVAGVIVAALYHHHRREQQLREFARELGLVRAAGEPATGDELLAYYRSLRTGPDATGAWQAAFAATMKVLPGRQLSSGALPPSPGEPWTDLPAVESYLGECTAAFAAIEKAVATPGDCLFLKDFDEFFGIVLSHVDGARQAELLLTYRAFARAHRGDYARATDDIHSLLRLAETLRLEPIFVTQLVRQFLIRHTLEVLEVLVVPGAFSDAQLASVQDALSQIDLHPAMAIATIGERVAGLQYFETPTDDNLQPVPALVHQTWTSENPAQFMAMMREFLAAARSPWPQPLVLTREYDSLAVEQASVKAPLGLGKWFSPSKSGGSMRQNLIGAAREAARIRAAVVALAAVRFRQEAGRRPKTLEELVPAQLEKLPTDPFTGRSLHMQEKAGGLVVYSVGIDGADGGGEEKIESDAWGRPRRLGRPDVVFEIRDGH
jgi:hypothetical protein